MIRVGVLRNPHSQRNRNRRLTTAAMVPAGAQVMEMEPTSTTEIPQVLTEFAHRGFDHLVVDGGDGTLREVMSALPGAFGATLPTLTVFSGGNANLSSVDIGTAGHGPEALPRLLAALANPQAGRRIKRRPIEIRWPGGAHPPVLAFFVGGAEFRRGWKLAVGAVRERGFLHGAGVSIALLGAAWQVLTGGPRNPWLAGTSMRIAIDDAEPTERARFLFLATSLHRLYGKLWPFFDHGDAAIRWLDIDAPPPRFGRALPGLLRGAPKHWVREIGAYRSGGAAHIALKLDDALVIDGEPFTAGADGLVELRSGPELEFYTPFAQP